MADQRAMEQRGWSLDNRLAAANREHRAASHKHDDSADHSGYTWVSIRVRPLDPTRGLGGSLTILPDKGEIRRGKEKFQFHSVFNDHNNEQVRTQPALNLSLHTLGR